MQAPSLCHTAVPNVNMHLRNIFAEGELQADSVIQKFLITAAVQTQEERWKEIIGTLPQTSIITPAVMCDGISDSMRIEK